MKQDQKDTQQSPTNVENNHKLKFGDQLRTQENMKKNEPEESHYEAMEDTPFAIRCINDEWVITMGNQALTHNHKTKEEALNAIEKEKWMVITVIATIVAKRMIEENNPTISPLKGLTELRKEETAG